MKSDQIRPAVVAFDCDGVLCEPFEFAKLLTSEFKITREMTAHFFKDVFPSALQGSAALDTILDPFLPLWGWERGTTEFIRLWLDTERFLRKEVVEVIAECKRAGYKVVLATNQERNRAHYLRHEMGAEKLFDHCYISCELGSVKPHHDFFSAICINEGCSPKDVLLIDDLPVCIKSAQTFGLSGLLFDEEVSVALDEIRQTLLL